eukprot:m.155549 g.155549  ORF g.155549 m.155549 type:complete len:96 (-) comp52913_c0_seq1:784-1071(-)
MIGSNLDAIAAAASDTQDQTVKCWDQSERAFVNKRAKSSDSSFARGHRTTSTAPHSTAQRCVCSKRQSSCTSAICSPQQASTPQSPVAWSRTPAR